MPSSLQRFSLPHDERASPVSKASRKYTRSAVLLCGLIGIIIWVVWKDAGEFKRLADLALQDLITLVGLCLALFIPNGLIRRILARPFGCRLDFLDWYGLSLASNLLSLVVPARGDLAFTAAYLKRRYDLSYTEFAGMTFGGTILNLVVLALQGSAAVAIYGYTSGQWNISLALGMLGFALLAILLLFPSKGLFPPQLPFSDKLHQAIDAWAMLRQDKVLVMKVTGLILLGSIIYTCWHVAAFRALNYQAPVSSIFFVGVLAQVTFLVTLTPNNLGLREAIQGLASAAVGIGFTEGVLVTLLQRLVSTIVFLLFGGISALLLMRRHQASQGEPRSNPSLGTNDL